MFFFSLKKGVKERELRRAFFWESFSSIYFGKKERDELEGENQRIRLKWSESNGSPSLGQADRLDRMSQTLYCFFRFTLQIIIVGGAGGPLSILWVVGGGVSAGSFRRQKHSSYMPRHHRKKRHVPYRTSHRIRHQNGSYYYYYHFAFLFLLFPFFTFNWTLTYVFSKRWRLL